MSPRDRPRRSSLQARRVARAPTRVLIPEPPHLFGYKAYANDRLCPREFPARLMLSADLPPGLHRFQVASEARVVGIVG